MNDIIKNPVISDADNKIVEDGVLLKLMNLVTELHNYSSCKDLKVIILGNGLYEMYNESGTATLTADLDTILLRLEVILSYYKQKYNN